MWGKNCPVCKQPIAKKQPTETVPCPCVKYVWKGAKDGASPQVLPIPWI
jgi:hypothetical protein